MAHLQLKALRKSYGDVQTLHGIDLEIQDGEFVVFVGPSGCGKSTLLRCIAGLEEITSGELHIGGQVVNEVPPAKRGIAMVFQSYALYPHMTVAENMAFGLRLAGYKKDEQQAAVKRAAQILQIEHLLERKPKALSGGQRQRVAIGRAIVRKPGVFLFDEPLSNLDAALRVQMRVELSRLHRELKTTMVYVTHDQVEAMTLANRIVVFNAGRIEQVGTPMQLYHQPANLFVAGFIGSPKMNFIPATLVAATAETAEVRLADGASVQVAVDARRLAPGAKVTLGARPEHIDAGSAQPGKELRGQVQLAEHLGDATYLYVEVAGAQAPVVVRADAANPLTTGDTARLGLAPQRCFLFDEQGVALPRAGA
ncbi:ABC transporter ATP-binding protein [Eleftheria terrae]|uniref:ABC transporter ATP-binding protein n=1 Tax=Eleftheria terrae TaxID=1597781 RepID=UPI00263B5004|nr:sn-glycerol-3-phosphate ABC transporter ATP-binding protein UgpC [Eleftheria terrae]WKB52963.1 sn-glycerol-3-phosphate ABC transporter ATP-binding protein UgpC [Eleftheria terrae]